MNYSCCECFFPRQSAQWQGLCVLGLTGGTVATWMLWAWFYEWSFICAASLNLLVSLLLMSALFKRASQLDDSVRAVMAQKKQQQQQGNHSNSNSHNSNHTTTEEARMMSYSQIQANKWSNFVELEDKQQQQNQSSSSTKRRNYAIPGMLYLGPLPIPLEFVAVGCTVLSTLVFLASYLDSNVYLSMTKLTSIEDWFRTFFLLSYGVVGTFCILYWLPTIVYLAKLLQRMCCCCCGGGGGGGGKKKRKQKPQLADEDHQPEDPVPQNGGADEENSKQDSAENGNDDDDDDDDSPEAAQAAVFRTAADVQRSTRFAVRVLGVVSLAMTILCLVLRWQETQHISPVMRWKKSPGSVALASYQGDAYVTAMPEIVLAENENDNYYNEDEDTFCTSSEQYVPVMVNLAWGGDWACPNSPETLCQSTVEAQVSCQYSKYPLPWQANVNQNENGYDAAQQQDGNNDEEEEDEGDAIAFDSVEDYITFRFQNPIDEEDENNQEQNEYNENQNQQQDATFDYDVSVAPNSDTDSLTWNRQALQILGNCENCEARTMDFVQEQFPDIVRALHGFFLSMGVLCASIFWGIILRVAIQRQSQRQATDGMFDM